MLSALEQQYDSTTVEQPALESRHVDVPSADAIGAEVEDFLRSIDDPSDDVADTEATGNANSDDDNDSAEHSPANTAKGSAPSSSRIVAVSQTRLRTPTRTWTPKRAEAG